MFRAGAIDPLRAVVVIEDYKPLDVECAAVNLALLAAIRRPLSRVAPARRRRRRRRESEGLSDRGEQRADDPQRRQQSHAVPGRMGRRVDQALAHLLRRVQSRLRPRIRLRARVWLRRLQPVHASVGHRRRRGHPVRRELTQGSHERLYALKGEIVARGIQAVLGVDDAGVSEAALSTRRGNATAVERLFPHDEVRYRRHFQTLFAA